MKEEVASTHRVIVSVGSNIDPQVNLDQTKKIVAREMTLLGEATVIKTEPDGFKAQPDFLNGAWLMETRLPLEEFNAYLKAVEIRMGRVKGPIKSGPRTIDLDIIIWDGKIVHSDYLERKDYVVRPVDELLRTHQIDLHESL